MTSFGTDWLSLLECWIEMTLANVEIVTFAHHSYCSKGKSICQGQPCATEMTPTPIPTGTVDHTTDASTCRHGWSQWFNAHHPTAGVEPFDVELIPNLLELVIQLVQSVSLLNQSEFIRIRFVRFIANTMIYQQVTPIRFTQIHSYGHD